ncbi:hypothetical protein BCEN4_350167 [Burkholderia cenocepacia]|nr:hypothetical protein BCEN4_350167 [Burkholderia cenocepacia]
MTNTYQWLEPKVLRVVTGENKRVNQSLRVEFIY